MNIDFKNMEEQRLEHFKGGEGVTVAKMYVDDTIRILKGYLEKDSSIGMHTHSGNSEALYILSGEGKVIYDGTDIAVTAGSCHYCPEGHSHSLVNLSDEPLHFLGVVPRVK